MDYYRKLAEELNPQEIRHITYLQINHRLTELQKHIEAQVLPVESLLELYTRLQYVEQKIEIQKGLNVVFRTLAPISLEEALRFAQKEADGNTDVQARVLGRRRLAYALVYVNGQKLGKLDISRPYGELMAVDKDFVGRLKENADEVYNFLSVYGLSERIVDAFNIWETVVTNRINGIDDLQASLKKSTEASASER